jgi:pimeloyl-ACP methyl ester carboxylesterase
MTPCDLACTAARSRLLSVNGMRLHTLEWGQAGRPALCFLHGGSAHAHWFDRVVPAFADRFHVVSLDQRGHGESAWAEPPAYATEDFAGDLLGVMEAFAWRRMMLVGHSMGGHNAMAFAAWHPERVSALVIADSRPSIPHDRLGVMQERGRRPLKRHPTVEAAIAAFRLLPSETVASPALLRHLAIAGVVQHDAGWVYRFDPATRALRRPVDAWSLIGRIMAPTLVVRGEWSPILPADLAVRLRDGIRDARLVEVAGAHHHLVLDRPEAFSDAVNEFVADVDPS